MSFELKALNEDFERKLDTIERMVEITLQEKSSRNTEFRTEIRTAATQGSTLLVAAIFEDFVRESAIEYTKCTLENATEGGDIPFRMKKKVAEKIKFEFNSKLLKHNPNETLHEFEERVSNQFKELLSLLLVSKGDYKHNVSHQIVETRANMSSTELDRLFSTIGISNFCKQLCYFNEHFQLYFDEEDKNELYDLFLKNLDGFYSGRNTIAHSLKSAETKHPDILLENIKFFRKFGTILSMFLAAKLNDPLDPNSMNSQVELVD